MTLDTLIAEAKALVEAATPGPWTVPHEFHNPEPSHYADDVAMIVAPSGEVVHHVYYDGHHLIAKPCDSAFIAASRQLVPALLDALAESQREVRGLLDERDAYRAMLCDVIASASPSKRDHPSMSKQWERATDLLKNGPAAATKVGS